MKRISMALAIVAAAALVGCGGNNSGGTGGSGSSGSTGQAASTSSTGSGSTGGSSGTTTTGGSGSTGTSASGSTSTGGSSGSTGFSVAAHDPFPQVPNVSGGPTLHHLQLVTITFNGYAHQAEVEAFGQWITGSDWLTAVGADYDVHTGSQIQKVELDPSITAPASVTDADIQQFLTTKLNDGTLLAPGKTIPGSTDTVTEPLYTIYYPSTTSISLDGQTSCSAFGGYHNFFTYTPAGGTATKVSYAVLPTCPAQWQGGNELDLLTVAMSHELIEAATDPFPDTGAGAPTGSYVIENFSSPWAFIPGEVGDLCVEQNYRDTASNYELQRVWSNSAAAALPGQAPCIPANPDAPFFNVSSNPTDTQAAAAGSTVTYQITAWSDRPYNATNNHKWYVGAIPYQSSFQPKWTLTTADGQTISDSSGQMANVSMGNGDTATLTVTIPTGTTTTSCGGYCYTSLLLYSTAGTDYSFNMWPVAVVMQ